MVNPCFDIPHGFAGLDRCRTGNAANPLPGCLGGVTQVRIGIGERLAFHIFILAFHIFIIADRVWTPQQRGRAVSRRYRNRRIVEFLKELDLAEGRSTGEDDSETLGEQDTEQDKSLEKREKESDTEQVTEQDTEQVGHLVLALTGEMRRHHIQDLLRIAHRPHFLQTYLDPALEAGVIEMTLPDKPTSRNQRYRRTSAGEALARQLTESSK